MTKLTKDVARETSTQIRDRGKDRMLCVTLKRGNDKYGGDCLELRPKSTSIKYTVSLQEIYELGRKNDELATMKAHGF
jgi:hypothetical protein